MSHKQAKEDRKELKAREQEFLKRLTALSEELKIGLQPVLQFTPTGVVPAMRLVDEVGQYEHLTPEAQDQNEAEMTAKSKDSPVPAEDPTPQIET